MHEPRAEAAAFWIEPLDGDEDLDGVLAVEAESFTNPWTRAMYAWELQNRQVCHIYVARTPACRVAGFCAFWLCSTRFTSTTWRCCHASAAAAWGRRSCATCWQAKHLGANRATLEVRASNEGALRLYERLGFHTAGRRPNYYSSPVEDALILWRDGLRNMAETGP